MAIGNTQENMMTDWKLSAPNPVSSFFWHGLSPLDCLQL